MLDKCGLSDRLRKVDIRLAEKEKQVVALEQKIEKSFESTESKENEPEDPMSPLGFQKVANNRSSQHISYNFFDLYHVGIVLFLNKSTQYDIHHNVIYYMNHII